MNITKSGWRTNRHAQGQGKEPPTDPHAPPPRSDDSPDCRESRHKHKLRLDPLRSVEHGMVEEQQDHTRQRKRHRRAPQPQRQRPGSSRTICGLLFHARSVSLGRRERKPTGRGGHYSLPGRQMNA